MSLTFYTISLGDIAQSDTLKGVLVDATYTPDKDHDYRADVTGQISGTTVSITGLTVTADDAINKKLIDHDDISYSAITCNPRYFLVYKDSGNAATDQLVYCLNFETTYTLTADNLTITVPTGGFLSYQQTETETNTDVLVKISSNDTTASYLNGKLVAGDNIEFTENNDGSNETLTVKTAANVAFTSVNINGTNGNGHIHLKHQASDPSSTGSSTTIFADSNGNLSLLNDGIAKATFDTDGITAARVWAFPDASGTVALTADLSSYLTSATAATTYAKLDGSNQPFTGALGVDYSGSKLNITNVGINQDGGSSKLDFSNNTLRGYLGSYYNFEFHRFYDYDDNLYAELQNGKLYGFTGFGTTLKFDYSGSTTNTLYGNTNISYSQPKITLTNTSASNATAYLQKYTTSDEFKLISQNRVYTIPNALTLAGATYGSGLSYTSTGALSFSFWWKTSSSGDSYFIGNSTATSDFRAGSGVLSFNDEAAGLARYWNLGTYNDNTWRMITLTISSDRATVKAYINATLATQTQAGTVGGNFIINRIFATNGNTTGSFDDFKIYTKELSQSEVTALYNSGAPSEVSSMTNMYAYYKLNEASGTSVTDSSGNARTVTLVGGTPVWGTGLVSSGINALSDIPIVRLANNTTNQSYGTLTLGYYSGSYATSNVYEGLSHTFTRLGSTVANLDGSKVLYGHNNTDNRGNAIIIGTGSTASLTSGTEPVVLVGVSNTGGGQRSGAFGTSITLGGNNNTFGLGYGLSFSGSQSIGIGNNLTSIPANVLRMGHDNNNYLNFTTAGVFTVVTGATTRLTVGSTYAVSVNGSTQVGNSLWVNSYTPSNTALGVSATVGNFPTFDVIGHAAPATNVVSVKNSGSTVQFAIDSSYNGYFLNSLGIGTTTMAEKVDVRAVGSADAFIRVAYNGTGNRLAGFKFGGGASNYGLLQFSASTNNVSLFQTYTSGDLLLGANSTEFLRIKSAGNILIAEGSNLETGTTTGSKIFATSSQKGSFWGATPIVQPTTAVAAATLVAGGGTALTDTDTFDGYTLKQVVKALRNIGILQ